MKTVKEMAELAGISARTIHYYDEIGLLAPTARSEAGYRLYDDRALEILQQILFFREFDITLKEIKAILEHPDLDRNQILQMQRKMLTAKKERLERQIASIDEILKGENRMDFTVFNETEIRMMYDDMEANMNEEQKKLFADHYGSMEAFRTYFLEQAASEQAQKNFAQVVQWYDSKEAALDAVRHAGKSDTMAENVPVDRTKYQDRLGEIQAEIAARTGTDVYSDEVRALAAEYIMLSQKLYQMDDVKSLMLDLAAEYRTKEQIQKVLDGIYGAGSTAYFGEVIAAYYDARDKRSCVASVYYKEI